MAKKTFSAEQIIGKLREAEVQTSQGKTVEAVFMPQLASPLLDAEQQTASYAVTAKFPYGTFFHQGEYKKILTCYPIYD